MRPFQHRLAYFLSLFIYHNIVEPKTFIMPTKKNHGRDRDRKEEDKKSSSSRENQRNESESR